MPRKANYPSQADYRRQYNEQAYDRLAITVPKGQKATIQAAADEAGESINAYTGKALLTRMGREEWPTLDDGQSNNTGNS